MDIEWVYNYYDDVSVQKASAVIQGNFYKQLFCNSECYAKLHRSKISFLYVYQVYGKTILGYQTGPGKIQEVTEEDVLELLKEE